MTTKELIRLDILTAAQEIAREKGLPHERVLGAVEDGLTEIARQKYGTEAHLRSRIDRKTGVISVMQLRTVVDEVQNPLLEISLPKAREQHPDTQLQETLEDPLPAVDFSHVPSRVIRQSVTKLIKQVVREKEYAEYKDRAGEVVTGVVKSIDFGQVIMDLGQAEGILPMQDAIRRERFRPDDRVRVYIKEVIEDPLGFQIFLSRTHPQFMRRLFEQEVPEIYSGTIQIKAIARDPGNRAKIAVISSDPSLDPVGSCVGIRGTRVKAVTQELANEHIDIVRWSEDIYTFLVNALTPTTVTKVIEGDEEGHVQVVVPDDQLSLAVGRGGQNIFLVSRLTGLKIQLISETEHTTQKDAFTLKVSSLFQTELGLNDMTARLLVLEGFETLEDLADSSKEELEELEGLTEGEHATLPSKAKEALARIKEKQGEEFIEKGGDPLLLSLDAALEPKVLLTLAEKGVKTKQNFAELASDELLEFAGDALSSELADALILKARGIKEE